MNSPPRTRLALVAWAVVLTGVALGVTVLGKSGYLYPTFVAAGEHFRLGEPIYGRIPIGQDQYRYSPLAAAAFAPWGYLPTPVGAVLWRWLQAVAFLLALRAWSRVAIPPVPWPALALLCLPLVAGNLFNAQLNPLVGALMLAALAAFARDRFWLSAAAITAAAVFKVYPLALGLLLCVVEPRRFGPRLAVAAVVGCALPFVLQSDQYVTRQFAEWVERVRDDDRSDMPIHRGYHDFQKLLRRWGLPTDLTTYRSMEAVAGLAMAAFLWRGRKWGWTRGEQVQACAGLGLAWCTLFGPATESATYMLLAPVAAQAFVAVTGRSWPERLWVRGAYFLLISIQIAVMFPRPLSDPYRALIPQAHAAVMLLAWTVWRSIAAGRAAHAAPRSPAADQLAVGGYMAAFARPLTAEMTVK